MRFLKILLILFPPFILYIGMQPQLNEIEQWMIGVFLFGGFISFLHWKIKDIREDIAEYKKLKKDYQPNKKERRARRVGGIFLVFVVGMTILGVLLTNYFSQSI